MKRRRLSARTIFPFKLVFVEWVDSSYLSGWLTEDDEAENVPKKCCSVGWIRKENADLIILASNLTVEENPHRLGETHIPKRQIIRTSAL